MGQAFARKLQVVPGSDLESDPALTDMRSVDGMEVSEPSQISRALEEMRTFLASIGVAQGAHFGVRKVDGVTRVVRMDEGGSVVGYFEGDRRAPEVPRFQVLGGGRD